MRAEAAGAERPPGLALRSGPLRSAPAGMADLLTSGLSPNEQDFIQAYEEVREKYKGTEPLAPAHPPGARGPSRLASLTVRRVPSCCPRRCPNRAQPVAASLTSLAAACSIWGPKKGMDALHRAPVSMTLIGHLQARVGGVGPDGGGGMCVKQGLSGSGSLV